MVYLISAGLVYRGGSAQRVDSRNLGAVTETLLLRAWEMNRRLVRFIDKARKQLIKGANEQMTRFPRLRDSDGCRTRQGVGARATRSESKDYDRRARSARLKKIQGYLEE